MCCACKCCVVFALLPAQCAVHVSHVLCLHYFQCSVLCVCRSYDVFALLPAQCAVCVSYVLCLHYCQHSVLCVQVLCCVCTITSTVCCVVSPVLCLLNVLPAQFALWGLRQVLLLLLFLFCYLFALLPAQCVVCVSPMLCLHYCQRSVLCV